MVNERKLWARYGRVKLIVGTYIALFFIVPFLSMCLSCLLHSKEIDGGIEGAIRLALLIGLKWYAIIFSILTVLFIIWFLYSSDTVEFTDDSILYYRWIFSKKAHETSLSEITECVFSDGLWKHQGDYVRGRKIILYNKNNVILELELYHRICVDMILKLRNKRIHLVDDNSHLKTIDNYFKIDFMSLSYEQQLEILKYYCKLTRTKYKTGEEILSKQQKKTKPNKAK